MTTTRLLTPRVLWNLEAICTVAALLFVLSEVDRVTVPGIWQRLSGGHLTIRNLAIAGMVFSCWGLLVRMFDLHGNRHVTLWSETFRVGLAAGGSAAILAVLCSIASLHQGELAGSNLFADLIFLDDVHSYRRRSSRGSGVESLHRQSNCSDRWDRRPCASCLSGIAD